MWKAADTFVAGIVKVGIRTLGFGRVHPMFDCESDGLARPDHFSQRWCPCCSLD